MMKMSIEPGLLRIFRLFIGLEAVAFLGIVISYGSWPGRTFEVPDTRFVVDLLGSAALFGYLSWAWLQRQLKGLYLPLALGFATLMPIVNSRIYLEVSPEANLPLLILSAWELIPMLFVPLVLAAWQYGLRAVILFCIIPGLLDISLAFAIAERLQQAPFRILSVIIIRSASLFVVGYIVAQLMKTQREQRRALLQANVQLSQHAATLEQLTVSRERNRLARELHDTVAHTLSGLAVNLEAIKTVLDSDSQAAGAMLDHSLATARTGLTETRRALKDLRASPLDDLGLSLALRSLAQTAAARANLQLDAQLPDDLGNLTPSVEQSVYRIAQEALENAVRHANARRLCIHVNCIAGRLSLLVADDGEGFDPAAVPEADRFGLRGMRERAAMAGGILRVTSAPGQGTAIRLELEVGRG